MAVILKCMMSRNGVQLMPSQPPGGVYSNSFCNHLLSLSIVVLRCFRSDTEVQAVISALGTVINKTGGIDCKLVCLD